MSDDADITPAMIEAGVKTAVEWEGSYDPSLVGMVEAIYRSMSGAGRLRLDAHPTDAGNADLARSSPTEVDNPS